MGGLFLDVIVAYIFKTAARLLKTGGSSRWPLAKGTVATANCRPQPALGCSTSHIVYSFMVNGARFWGMDEKAFIFQNSAKHHAERFLPESSVRVRYKPAEPTVSAVRDEDQVHP
ncbi:MAG: hypothetical protein DMG21_10065 [Acidobacteria bacterium]|nr:MAG: hypothetical protein DMG21_10065 [Acidobacteriota bacterium]